MHPVLVDTWVLGWHVAVGSYGVMLALAALAASAVAWLLARRRGLPGAPVAIVLGAGILAAVAGARLLFVALDLPAYVGDPWRALAFEPNGFALMGGLLLAAGVVAVAAYAARLPLPAFADACAPALGVGIALVRVGCFLNGCCFGTVTRGPLGVTFPLGSPAHLAQLAAGIVGPLGPVLPVHPTQLYELAGALACAALAGWVLWRRGRDGSAFLAFAAGFSALRWLELPLRVASSTSAAPGWLYPVLYAAILAVCAIAAISGLGAAGAPDPTADGDRAARQFRHGDDGAVVPSGVLAHRRAPAPVPRPPSLG